MQLKKENCISDDAKDVLLESFGKHRNLIDWFDQQIGQKKIRKESFKEVFSGSSAICFIPPFLFY